MSMQHDDVMTVENHDYCESTNFCKRCGLHKQYADYHSYACAFSLNLISISHMRANVIAAEAKNEKKKRQKRKSRAELSNEVITKYLAEMHRSITRKKSLSEPAAGERE